MGELTERTKQAWLAALTGEGYAEEGAVAELGEYLTRVLRKVLRSRSLTAEEIADLVQESLLRLMEYAHTFRGESNFVTWATAVATRVAFTELRKRKTHTRALEQLRRASAERQAAALHAPPTPSATLAHRDLVTALRVAIDTCLTPRQRAAIVAELQGVPTVLIAQQLDLKQNALYKLTYDARKKLRAELLAGGFTADHLDTAVERHNDGT